MKKILLGLIALIASASLSAQNYPNRPVRLVVPFAPGGSTDAVGRLVAASLGPRLGQVVIVENRPGAASQIGLESVMRSPADGYTLLLGSTDGLAIVPAMKKQSPYDPVKDFTPIAIIARVPLVFVVNSKFAPSSLAELIAYAKAKPDAVRYGSAGVGSLLHLGVEQLVASTGTQMLHVPYKGGGPMMQDIVAGQIELVVTAADFTKRFVDSGQLKALAVADSSRHPLIPNVPTTAEVGMPDLLVVSWFGILGPANLPRPIVDAVSKELVSVMGEATLTQRLLQVGASATYEPPAEYARHIAEEQRRWTRLVKEANIPLQD